MASSFVSMDRNNTTWIDHLSSPGPTQEAALTDLGEVLRRGLDGALGRKISQRQAFIEDAVQDTLLKVLSHLAEFRGRSRFTTWAVSIAVREAFGELRRRRSRDVSLDSLALEDSISLAPPGNPEASDGNLDRRRILRALQHLIDRRLTAKQRQVLRAKLEGLEQSEIARRMPDVKRNAVYKLAHDARKSLKKGLIEEGFSEATIRHAFEF
ncbi:MAG: RNA polymerase sigma factor [Acidobacteriota bacterium]